MWTSLLDRFRSPAQSRGVSVETPRPRILVPPVTALLPFSEYAPNFAPEAVIHVWLNPPARLVYAYDRLKVEIEIAAAQWQNAAHHLKDSEKRAVAEASMAEAALALKEADAKIKEWLVQVWSAHPDPETHWTLAELDALDAAVRDTDPGFIRWLLSKTWALIVTHRSGLKKN